ncbi:EamA family transporter [Candidatus Gottesmanbacteria bacterium]|nr:EamA family transporter [Candidatus Gottesmanbacteria bacterium]
MIAIFYSIGTALLFAIGFFFRKQALGLLPLPVILWIEYFVAYTTAFIVFFFFIINKSQVPINNVKGIIFASLTGLFVFLGIVLNYLALRSDSLSKVVSITSPAQIVFAVILGIIFLKDNLTVIQMFGIFLSVVGIVLITR